MKIGIIGAGELAVALARYALAAGHEVVLSSSGDMENWRVSSHHWQQERAQGRHSKTWYCLPCRG